MFGKKFALLTALLTVLVMADLAEARGRCGGRGRGGCGRGWSSCGMTHQSGWSSCGSCSTVYYTPVTASQCECIQTATPVANQPRKEPLPKMPVGSP